MSSAQVVHPDEQAHERSVPGPEPSTELRSDLKADERSDPCALAAAVLRAHVEADLAADACGDDSDVRRPCRKSYARARAFHNRAVDDLTHVRPLPGESAPRRARPSK